MSALSNRAQRESLTIRILAEDRELIDEAAKRGGQTRTEFIIDAARLAAEEALLDRTTFVLNEAAFAVFMERLNEPPRVNERFKKLMQSTDPWDEAV